MVCLIRCIVVIGNFLLVTMIFWFSRLYMSFNKAEIRRMCCCLQFVCVFTLDRLYHLDLWHMIGL